APAGRQTMDLPRLRRCDTLRAFPRAHARGYRNAAAARLAKDAQSANPIRNSDCKDLPICARMRYPNWQYWRSHRMKKKKTVGIDTTRRRFMAYFTGLGLGSTLVPGVLWARMQDAGAQSVTLAMVTDALKLSGVEFTEAERDTMVAGANQ